MTANQGAPQEEGKAPPVPGWLGNTPFPPDKKRPCKIAEEMYVPHLYGVEGTQVGCYLFISTDKVSMGDWILPPGSHYAPAGLHLYGDECYYLLQGEATAFNAETGETFLFGAEDAMLIPQATRHQIFNMTKERIVALTALAPKIWVDDGMGTIIPQVASPRFYKGPEEPTYERAPLASSFPRLKQSIDSLGSWPAPGPELRKAKQLTIIRPEDQLALIHGKERHVLFSFIVSNDYLHLAILKVPVAGISELERHQGDEGVHILEGELCVRIPTSEEERKDNAVYPYTKLKAGETMLIPEGVKHQYLNFTNGVVKAFVAIAPRL